MRKTLTAGLTALSLILIPAAPVHADSNDGRNRAILGLIAAGAIGLAISESQSKPTVTVVQNTRHSTRNAHRRVNRATPTRRATPRAAPLPGGCYRQIDLGRGRTQNVFTENCLDRHYSDTAALPNQCLTRLGGRDGSRRGYDANCLQDRGFRNDRRR